MKSEEPPPKNKHGIGSIIYIRPAWTGDTKLNPPKEIIGFTYITPTEYILYKPSLSIFFTISSWTKEESCLDLNLNKSWTTFPAIHHEKKLQDYKQFCISRLPWRLILHSPKQMRIEKSPIALVDIQLNNEVENMEQNVPVSIGHQLLYKAHPYRTTSHNQNVKLCDIIANYWSSSTPTSRK